MRKEELKRENAKGGRSKRKNSRRSIKEKLKNQPKQEHQNVSGQ